jgi:hypothetical protein
MRHLRKFNESRDIPNSIEDILLDITDLGYLSRIEHILWTKVEGDSSRSDACVLTIYDKRSNEYKGMICIEEIIETLERLVSYLESEGYKLEDLSQRQLESIIQTNQKDAKSNQKFKISINDYVSTKFFTQDNKWYINSTSLSFDFKKQL